MAARDGSFRDGEYHFDCEACGRATTARRSHARSCSPTCTARLRRKGLQHGVRSVGGQTKRFRFYVSLQKLKSCLEAVEADLSAESELVVGFQGDGAAPEFARLCIEANEQDGQGGLVCTLDAPFNPFGNRAELVQRVD